jgi:hypothetical protein
VAQLELRAHRRYIKKQQSQLGGSASTEEKKGRQQSQLGGTNANTLGRHSTWCSMRCYVYERTDFATVSKEVSGPFAKGVHANDNLDRGDDKNGAEWNGVWWVSSSEDLPWSARFFLRMSSLERTLTANCSAVRLCRAK